MGGRRLKMASTVGGQTLRKLTLTETGVIISKRVLKKIRCTTHMGVRRLFLRWRREFWMNKLKSLNLMFS